MFKPRPEPVSTVPHLKAPLIRAGKEPIMTTLRNRWSALLLTLALLFSLTAPAMAAEANEAAAAPKTLEETAAAAAEAVMAYGTASVQYALWDNGEIVLTGSAGVYSKTENRLLTEDILYNIGSVSKVYTTTAVLQLAEKRKLSLDEPVVKYLPDFKMADPRYKDITVRMLLNHSSGLMGSSFENAMLFGGEGASAADQLLEHLSTQRLKADPGAYSVYCNDGFTLAELVVEAVSGKDFMDYLRENILKPLDLSNTYASYDEFDTSRMAKTYSGEATRPLPADRLNAVGAGGLCATASDMATFGGALTGTKLLKQSSLDAMAEQEYAKGVWPESGAPDALAFGLGWDNVEWYPFAQSGVKALVKGGDTLRYHAGLVILPDHQLAAAVLSSGGASTYDEMAANQILLAALKEKGVEIDETLPLPAESAPAPMPQELTALSGCYSATSAQYQVEVTSEGMMNMSFLTAKEASEPTSFTYRADGTFRDETGAVVIKLETASNGETYLYQQTAAMLPDLGGLTVSSYAAVKLPENPVSEDVQAIWEKYAVTDFLPVSEQYNSQVYLSLSEAVKTASAPGIIPGYIGSLRIVDKTHAQYQLQIPGVAGRDGNDMTIWEEDGIMWAEAGCGGLYMEAQKLPILSTGNGPTRITIQSNGYARWCRTWSSSEKTMAIEVPENAGFWVYDKDLQLVASSVLWGDTTVTLPEDGYVAFMGEPGAQFRLQF